MAHRFLDWISRSSAMAYVVAALIGVFAVLAAYFVGRGLGSERSQFDLRIYFHAVRYWANGGYLYDYAQPDVLNGSLGFTYPPISAVLMWPMTLLSWPLVRLATVGAIVLAGAIFVWLIVRDSVRLRGASMVLAVGLITAIAFLYDPFRQTLSFGQVNLFLAVLVAFDLLYLGRKGSRWVGIGIGLAVAIKLTPGIFIVYLLVTKRWRAMIIASVTAVVASLGAALFARREVWNFYTDVLWDTSRVGHVDTRFNQSINGLLARLASPEDPSKAIWALGVLVVAGYGIWRARSLYNAGDELSGMTVAGLVGLMVSPVSWGHHAVWVVPATVVLVHRAIELYPRVKSSGSVVRRQFYTAVAMAVIGFGWIFSAEKYVADLTPDWSGANLWTQALASLPTFWMLALIAVLPAREQLPLAVADRRISARHLD